MKKFLKIAVFGTLFLSILSGCNSDKSKKENQNTQNQKKDTTVINKDQYRIAEQFTGSKNQIIDLMTGPANFVLVHQGDGPFVVRLMTAEGEVLDVLADVTGNYTGKKRFDVTETRAYILDVRTEGGWSVYRE